MPDLSLTREAKQFLVDQIVDEAAREDVSLSPVERDMLYFTESAWSPLPDCIATNDAFENECNSEEYEQKIEALIRNLRTRTRKLDSGEFLMWQEAVRTINNEDHYLLVMIRNATGSHIRGSIWPSWRMVLGGVVLGLALLFALIVFLRLQD